jgi:hypothetical protein
MGFNDVPSVSDTSKAMERRMRILNFERCFVEQLTEPHHLPIGKKLTENAKQGGAQMMLMLIDRFNRHGFAFSTLELVLQFAEDFLAENDVLIEFLDEHVTFVDSPLGKKLSLMELFTKLKRGRYADLFYVPQPQALSQMLRNKGLALRRHMNKTDLWDATFKHSECDFVDA